MSLSSRKETKPERGTRTRQQERVAEYITRLAREKQAGEPDWLIEHFVQQGLRVLELEQQKTEQARQIEAQAAEIVELKEKLAQAERAGKRQAAPFRRSKRKTQPKRPGRKAGHRGHWRQPPAASAADEHYEMPLETCPDCGQPLDKEHQQAIEQTVIDVPPVEPRVIRLKTLSQPLPKLPKKTSAPSIPCKCLGLLVPPAPKSDHVLWVMRPTSINN